MPSGELIKRLEEATEGSRQLDAEIQHTISPWDDASYAAESDGWVVNGATGIQSPFYTTSLDAALTLVPELVSLSILTGTQKEPTPSWTWPVVEARDNATDALIWKGQAKSLPLAICIAALKARQA